MPTAQSLYLHSVKAVTIRPIESHPDAETAKLIHWREIVIEYDGGILTIALCPKNRHSQTQLQIAAPAALV